MSDEHDLVLARFALRFRVAMAVAGTNETHLARHLGTSTWLVAKWRCGEAMPRSSHLMAICRLTGCSLDWLMDPEPVDIRSPSEATLRIRREALAADVAALKAEAAAAHGFNSRGGGEAP